MKLPDRVLLAGVVLAVIIRWPVGQTVAAIAPVSCFARVTISTDLIVAPLNPYDVQFASARSDSCGMWSAFHPTTLVVTAPGFCIIGGNFLWASSASGTYRLARLYVGGIERASQSIPAFPFWTPQAITTGFAVSAGDSLSLQLQHDASAPLTVYATGESADLWAECVTRS